MPRPPRTRLTHGADTSMPTVAKSPRGVRRGRVTSRLAAVAWNDGHAAYVTSCRFVSTVSSFAAGSTSITADEPFVGIAIGGPVAGTRAGAVAGTLGGNVGRTGGMTGGMSSQPHDGATGVDPAVVIVLVGQDGRLPSSSCRRSGATWRSGCRSRRPSSPPRRRRWRPRSRRCRAGCETRSGSAVAFGSTGGTSWSVQARPSHHRIWADPDGSGYQPAEC